MEGLKAPIRYRTESTTAMMNIAQPYVVRYSRELCDLPDLVYMRLWFALAFNPDRMES